MYADRAHGGNSHGHSRQSALAYLSSASARQFRPRRVEVGVVFTSNSSICKETKQRTSFAIPPRTSDRYSRVHTYFNMIAKCDSRERATEVHQRRNSSHLHQPSENTSAWGGDYCVIASPSTPSEQNGLLQLREHKRHGRLEPYYAVTCLYQLHTRLVPIPRPRSGAEVLLPHTFA